MFKWISDFSRDVRISLDWPRFNKVEHVRFVTEAFEQYPTMALEADLEKRLECVRNEVDARFKSDLESLNREAAALEPQVTQAKRLALLFQRNFRADLEALYAEKDRLHAELMKQKAKKSAEYEDLCDLQDQKAELHERRQKLQSEIDGWYAKANRHRYLDGKKGKEIPKSALFGISQNDLESVKAKRAAVFKALDEVQVSIDCCSSIIGTLNKEIEQTKATLDANRTRILGCKKDRTEFFEARKAGKSRKVVREESEGLSREMNQIHNSIIALENERKSFIVAAHEQHGIETLRREIHERIETRNEHIRAYDLPDQKLQRKKMHREEWLALNG